MPAFDAVIVGAGISGISAARYLTRALAPSARIAIVTKHAPCQYTSSLSTECFRDHWPSQVMRSFMGRSIDLLHEQGREHSLNIVQAGYLYVTGEENGAKDVMLEANACYGQASGAVRKLSTPLTQHQPPVLTGADVYTTGTALRNAFPWLDSGLTAGLHARNAGWTSAHTMGVSMLDEIRALRTPSGEPRVQLVRGEVRSVDIGTGMDKVRSVRMKAEGGGEEIVLHTPVYVNAAGPYLSLAHEAMFPGSESAHETATGVPRTVHALPVYSEVHSKVVFRDTLGAIPRDAPMTIANHALTLPWAEGELEFLAETVGRGTADRLSKPIPGGAHFRPYGGPDSDAVLMLWECWHHTPAIQGRIREPPSDSVDSLLDVDMYPEVVVRGLSRIVPDLAAYFDGDAAQRLYERKRSEGKGADGGGAEAGGRKPSVDGGYYTKTAENIPLIGPAPGACGHGGVAGAYICGAVSGYGIMAAHAAGELLAAHVQAGTADGTSGSAARTLAAVASDSSSSGKGVDSRRTDYAALMSPQRYQWSEFTRPGGWREELMAAGGGQL